jgi:phosphatidylglycerophosphate synthase
LFGSMAMCMNGKNVVWYTGLGVIITIISSIILYFMRTRVYGRKSIPSTKGETKTLWTPGAWIWILIQLLLYVYVFYVILKQSYN